MPLYNPDYIKLLQQLTIARNQLPTTDGSDTVRGDSTLTGNGTIATPLGINTTAETTRIQSVVAAYLADNLPGISGGSSYATTSQLATTNAALSSLSTAVGGKLTASSNLSDLSSVVIARTNLGLGSLALKSSLAAGDIPNLSASYLSITGGSLTGASGTGFLGLPPQATAPSAPFSGVVLYARDTGAFSWKGTNGFQRSFIGSGITADRDYTLPDNSGTLALASDLSSYTPAARTVAGFPLSSNVTLGALTATDSTLTLSGTYNGSAAQTVGLNLGSANTWTANQVVNAKIGVGSATAPAASLHFTGTTFSTANSFNANGLGLRQDNCTYTSTTASGTITNTGVNSFGVPTLAASSPTILTNAATVYIGGSPAAGTNVTITNPFSLYIPFGNVSIANQTFSNRLLAGSSAFSTGGIASTQGVIISASAPTITDTATAASGTVTHGAANALGAPVIAAANTGVVYSSASTLFIAGPVSAGTNVTITRPLSLAVNTGETSLASFSTAYIAKGVNYTLGSNDQMVEVTAAGVIITLPDATKCTGREYLIKLTASGTASISTFSGQLIDGVSTYSLTAQYKYVRVKSNGTNWLVIAQN